MVGSRQMERVLSAVQEAGAKVVLVGDPEQLQAIEAGAAFRALAERHGAAEIGAVRRQREAWQREATRELATGRTGAALERYERAGMVRGHVTQEAARAALVAGWTAERRAAPGQSRVMLATTRADVATLNALARDRLRQAGELGPDQAVQTERGERAMAAGDRLMFLRNERALGVGPGGRGGVAVKNGSLGTVLAVDAKGERLTVALDGPGGPAGAGGQEGQDARPVATFYTRDYGHLDYGYAATIHKAQGVTVDRAHVLASAHMDRHAAYVALTRHRAGVALHWSAEQHGDRAGLGRSLGRERAEDTSLDYAGPERAGEELLRGAQAYAERRGLDPLRPESAIVARQRGPGPAAARRPAPGPDLAQDVAAGRARFRGRFEAHRRQQAEQAQRAADAAAARELVGQWDRLADRFNAALPQLDADPSYGPAREALLGFGQAVRGQPGAVAALRRQGEAFGLETRPGLARLLADRTPERLIEGMVDKAEAGMRARLEQERAARQAAQEAARRQARERARASQRHGPSLGM